MMKHSFVTLLFLLAAGTGLARADDDCHVPMNQWQPKESVEKMANSRGWTVTRIKIDDGCYEIRGSDNTGRAFKAKIDPANLAIVKLKYKDRDHDRDDDRHGSRHGKEQSPNSSATPVAPSSPLFEKNARPNAIVK